MAGCLTCTRDGQFCLTCDTGLYLFSGAGLLDGSYDSCIACDNANQRIHTAHVSNAGGICVYCSQGIENCNECNNDTTSCEVCKANFYQWDTNSNTDAYERCVSCIENFYYLEGTVCKRCYNKIPHCLECNRDGTLCNKCEKNYFKYKTTTAYDTCIPCGLASEYKVDPNASGEGQCDKCLNANPLCIDCNGNASLCSNCIVDYFTYDTANDGVLNLCTKCEAGDYPGHFVDSKLSMI
jgi:hypothetical protein